MDRLPVCASTLQANDIQSSQYGVVAGRHPVRDDVGVHARDTTNHRALSDPTMLLHRRQSAEDYALPDMYVPCQSRTVCEVDIIFDDAVMANMAVGHEVTIVPHCRNTTATPTTDTHCDSFADDAVGANDEPGVLEVIVSDLSLATQHSLRVDDCARSDFGMTRHDDMRNEAHAFVEHSLAPNDTIGPDFDPRSERGSILDNRRGVHRHS